MTSNGNASGCRYHYNPLDQLIASNRPGLATQRFYRAKQLVTELSTSGQSSLVQSENQLLALQQRGGANEGQALLASDANRSILHALGSASHALCYSPYGYRGQGGTPIDLPGFNGELPESITGHYLLGNYRLFNCAIMRFHSPDNLSPFHRGGLNPYAYALGDPINLVDPDGHKPISIIAKMLGLSTKAKPKASSALQEMAASGPGSIASSASDDSLEFGIRLKREPSGVLENKPGKPRSPTPAATHDGPVVSMRNPDWGTQHPADFMPEEAPQMRFRFAPSRPLVGLHPRDPRLRGRPDLIALAEQRIPPSYHSPDIGGGLPSYEEATATIASIRRN